MIRRLLHIGDARLGRVAHSVPKLDTASLHRLVRDMVHTMRHARGSAIAAPQVGIALRVVVLDVPRLTVLVNPLVHPLSHETCDAFESCLSLPGTSGSVRRHRLVRYTAFDAGGRPIAGIAEGNLARIVQHQCDHLDGILYTDRLGSGWSRDVMARMPPADSNVERERFEVKLLH